MRLSLQYGKVLSYCKQQETGWGLENKQNASHMLSPAEGRSLSMACSLPFNLSSALTSNPLSRWQAWEVKERGEEMGGEERRKTEKEEGKGREVRGKRGGKERRREGKEGGEGGGEREERKVRGKERSLNRKREGRI